MHIGWYFKNHHKKVRSNILGICKVFKGTCLEVVRGKSFTCAREYRQIPKECKGASIYDVLSGWEWGWSQKIRQKEHNQLICEWQGGSKKSDADVIFVSPLSLHLENVCNLQAGIMPDSEGLPFSVCTKLQKLASYLLIVNTQIMHMCKIVYVETRRVKSAFSRKDSRGRG